MKWGPMIIGGLIVSAIGFGVWAAIRGPGMAPHKFKINPLYQLPQGLTPLEITDVPYGAIQAVKRVHGAFRLSEAYTDGTALYLVETHEGFSPLVFYVTEE